MLVSPCGEQKRHNGNKDENRCDKHQHPWHHDILQKLCNAKSCRKRRQTGSHPCLKCAFIGKNGTIDGKNIVVWYWLLQNQAPLVMDFTPFCYEYNMLSYCFIQITHRLHREYFTVKFSCIVLGGGVGRSFGFALIKWTAPIS